jgi:hypothetical protein
MQLLLVMLIVCGSLMCSCFRNSIQRFLYNYDSAKEVLITHLVWEVSQNQTV